MFGESMMHTLGNVFFSKGGILTILGFSGHVVQVAITSCGTRKSVSQIRRGDGLGSRFLPRNHEDRSLPENLGVLVRISIAVIKHH